jgi:E3 ubiquitin-protein ligase SH3RF
MVFKRTLSLKQLALLPLQLPYTLGLLFLLYFLILIEMTLYNLNNAGPARAPASCCKCWVPNVWNEKRKPDHRKKEGTRWEVRNDFARINTDPTSSPLRATCRCSLVPFRQRPPPAPQVTKRWLRLPLLLSPLETRGWEAPLRPSWVRGTVLTSQVAVYLLGVKFPKMRICCGQFRFRCITPYPPNSEYELELRIGDIVYVHKKRDDGWYKGTLHRTGKTGLFPASFVESC